MRNMVEMKIGLPIRRKTSKTKPKVSSIKLTSRMPDAPVKENQVKENQAKENPVKQHPAERNLKKLATKCRRPLMN